MNHKLELLTFLVLASNIFAKFNVFISMNARYLNEYAIWKALNVYAHMLQLMKSLGSAGYQRAAILPLLYCAAGLTGLTRQPVLTECFHVMPSK